MILVLKGADFSANNIGKVQVTTKLQDYTKAAIAASGNTNLTGEQKSALDRLFVAMGVDGSNNVMSKIRFLYLPIIAQSVKNSFINYARDTFEKDYSPTEADFAFVDNGIVKTTKSKLITKVFSPAIQQTNFTHLWLNTSAFISGQQQNASTLELRGKTNTSLWLLPSQMSNSGGTSVLWGTSGADWGYQGTKDSLDGLRVAGVVSRSMEGTYINRYGTWVNKNVTYTSDFTAETSQTMYALGSGVYANSIPIGAIVLGEAITIEQAKAISKAIEELHETFKS